MDLQPDWILNLYDDELRAAVNGAAEINVCAPSSRNKDVSMFRGRGFSSLCLEMLSLNIEMTSLNCSSEFIIVVKVSYPVRLQVHLSVNS